MVAGLSSTPVWEMSPVPPGRGRARRGAGVRFQLVLEPPRVPEEAGGRSWLFVACWSWGSPSKTCPRYAPGELVLVRHAWAGLDLGLAVPGKHQVERDHRHERIGAGRELQDRESR